ncbi:MAG TPA: hypothetical protein VFF80_08585 [Bacillota bacterium]|nr:hypothetical protein [Bacillota bacterium]
MSLIAILDLTFAYESSYDTSFAQVNLQLLLGDYPYQGTISSA